MSEKVLLVLPHAPFSNFNCRIHSLEDHPDMPVVKRTLALREFFRRIVLVSGSSHSFGMPVMFDNIEYHTIKGRTALHGFFKAYDIKLLAIFLSSVLHYGRSLKVLNFSMASSSVVLCILSKTARIKFVTFFTSVPEAASKYKRKVLFDYKVLLMLSSKILTNNPFAKSRLLQIHFRRDIEIVPNFVEPKFKPFNLPRNLNWVLYAGRLDPEKRVSHLLQSFSLLKKSVSEARLYVIGDGPELEYLRILSEKLGVAESVRFLGWVAHGDLPLWMNQCGIFTLPSIHEGSPNVLLEAMACGTPVVCMDSPSIRWVVNGAGLLVQHSSIVKLMEAIEIVLLKNDLWNELSENGIARASDFKKEQFVMEIVKAL